MHGVHFYQNNFLIPFWGLGSIIGGFFIFLVIIWSLYWKGHALWKAARDNDTTWFITLLIINTFGILEILSIYKFSEKIKNSEQG